jgi:hypothetical protein
MNVRSEIARFAMQHALLASPLPATLVFRGLGRLIYDRDLGSHL